MTGKIRAGMLAIAGALALGGCTYGDYGYGGVSVGVGSGGYYGYDDPYYGGYGYPSYGWYDGYYYPGYGYYVYDRAGSRRAWRDSDRRHWEGRRDAHRGGWERNRERRRDGNWHGNRADEHAGAVDRDGNGRPDWQQRGRQDRGASRWRERASRTPDVAGQAAQPQQERRAAWGRLMQRHEGGARQGGENFRGRRGRPD